MLTNRLAECAHLTITVSDILVEIVIFSYPLAFEAPVRGGGVPVGTSPVATPFGMEKTRMVWLPDGEKISKISLFVLAQLTNVTDRWTDRHRVPAIPRLCIASRGKNVIK